MAVSSASASKPAARLTRGEAARLAAVPPNPRHWNPAQPTAYIQWRMATIDGRVRQLGPENLRCIDGRAG